MKIEIEMKGTRFGSVYRKGNKEPDISACHHVLRREYPGEDWTKVRDCVLIISNRRFDGSIQSSRQAVPDVDIRKLLGMPVWEPNMSPIRQAELDNYDFTKRDIYWAIEVYSD